MSLKYRIELKIIFKGIISFFIVLSILYPQTVYSKNLRIRNEAPNTNISVEITEAGDVVTDLSIDPNKGPMGSSSGDLVITKTGGGQEGIKIKITNTNLYIKNDVRNGNRSPALTGDFSIYSEAQPKVVPQAIIGGNNENIEGDLMVYGAVEPKPPEVTYYVDNEGVFVKNGATGLIQFAYANIGSEGRTIYSDGIEQENLYYIKDHLGSTRMTIDETGGQAEIIAYTAYGIQNELATGPQAPTRERFTGKELDMDGEDVGNGVAGLQLVYFGARYYDPGIGMWTSTDPVQQYYNPYKYTANPICFIDPDGMMNKFWTNFWRFIGASALEPLTGGMVSATSAFALGAAATVGTALIDPGVYMLSGSINNTFHNIEGIKDGKPVTKTITSWFGGLASGLADWGNMVTFGILHDIAADQSSAAIGYSHNYAFDKRWDDPEAYDISNAVLTDIYSYGIRGTWTKMAGDLVYSGHVLGEDPMVEMSRGSMYKETKNRFHYMYMKMSMQGEYSEISPGHNNAKDQLAHSIGGKILGKKVYYFGFEVWGENYVRWEADDYNVDGNTGELTSDVIKSYWGY